jgi:hypothetical protein
MYVGCSRPKNCIPFNILYSMCVLNAFQLLHNFELDTKYFHPLKMGIINSELIRTSTCNVPESSEINISGPEPLHPRHYEFSHLLRFYIWTLNVYLIFANCETSHFSYTRHFTIHIQVSEYCGRKFCLNCLLVRSCNAIQPTDVYIYQYSSHTLFSATVTLEKTSDTRAAICDFDTYNKSQMHMHYMHISNNIQRPA